MKNNEEFFIKIKEFPLFQYILRALFLAWIVFAWMKFEENPKFFGITMGLAAVFFFTLVETSVVATDKYLMVQHSRWIPFLTSRKKFYFDKIANLEYEMGETSVGMVFLNILEHIPGTSKKGARLRVNFKDRTSTEFDAVGNDTENQMLVGRINFRIEE